MDRAGDVDRPSSGGGGAAPDVVLVHGTTQTAAGYARLVAALAARGHRTFAVEVPCGTRSTAAGYAEVIAAGLPADLRAPVVVAHSGSGVLLPALARRLDAVHQVWLAAAVADHRGGRSLLTEIGAEPSAVLRPEWIGVDPSTDPARAAHFLFHDAGPDVLREVLPTVAVCDLAGAFAETPPVDPAARPSTYVLPAGDRCLQPAWMDRIARERLGVEPVVRDGGHNLYVAHADAVADMIARAAVGR